MTREALALTYAIFSTTALLMMVISAGRAATEPPTPVASVDLDRYAGLWYEIARIPNRFQKQCASGTTARYELRDDGRIDVTNRCLKENGEIDEAQGVAKVVDEQSNARLKVSFVKLFGWSLFWGDYWIIGLGEDYEYALVGTGDRKYGWILSRTPTLGPEVLERIHTALREQGYDPDRFEMTRHE